MSKEYLTNPVSSSLLYCKSIKQTQLKSLSEEVKTPVIRHYLKAGWFLTCLLLCASVFAQSDYYYYSQGVKKALSLSPTKVTVMFSQEMSQEEIHNFILSDSALDPNRGPLRLMYEFFVLYMQPGNDPEALVKKLRARQEVTFANPAYLMSDSGIVFVTDQFVAQFYSWVSRSTIDSLNALHGTVIVDSLGLEMPYLYLLRLTGAKDKDVLVTANQYYEDSTTDYSHPDFIVHICNEFCEYFAGDFDGDSSITIKDVVILVNYLFRSGYQPFFYSYMGDMNCDGEVSLGDVVYLVNYLFRHGPKPEDCLWSP